jgi:opacity protein-like surface antigen
MQTKFAAAALAAALVTGGAYAADLNSRSGGLKDGPVWGSTDIVASNNQIAIQFAATNFDYIETGDPARGLSGTLDTERNWVPGVTVEFSLMRNWIVSNLYFDARHTYLDGATDYRGSGYTIIDRVPAYHSLSTTSGAVVNDFDFRLGKGFEPQPNLMLTPYVGAGYHNWQRMVNGGEEYSNGYVGGGLLAQWSPVSRLVLSAHGLMGSTFASSISVSGGYEVAWVMATRANHSFSGPLGDSRIYRAGLGADYALAGPLHLNASVEWVDFKYGESDIYDHNYEPDSSTQNTTVRVGVGYALGGDYSPLR